MIERKELVYHLRFRNFVSIHFHGRMDFAFAGFEASVINGFSIDFVTDISYTLLIMMSKAQIIENLNNHILISTRLLFTDFSNRWFSNSINPGVNRIIKLRVIVGFGAIERLSEWGVLLVAVILVQHFFLDVTGFIHETNRVSVGIFRVITIEIILLYFLGVCQIGHIAHF